MIASEEFLTQMIESLCIIVDRHPKRRSHKMED